jgi:uncharacterized protein YkwD
MQGQVDITKYAKIFFIPCEENHYRPKSLENRSFLIILLILISLKAISIFSFYEFLGADIFNQISKADIYSLTNEIRLTNNVPELKINDTLEASAQMKLNDMINQNYFAHQSPTGNSPWAWFDKAKYDYSLAGENLAMNFVSSNEVMRAWLNSESHKKNLLYKDFSEIGVAVGLGVINNQNTTIVVQHFAKPIEIKKQVVAKTTPKITPIPRPKTVVVPTITPKPEKSNPISLAKSGVVQNAITQKSNSVIANGAYYTNLTSRNLLMIMALASFVIFMLKILIAIKIQYPDMIAKGLILVLVCIALIYLDDHRFLISRISIGGEVINTNLSK